MNFDSGQYTFAAGLIVPSTASNASLVTPSGNGVFFYFPNAPSFNVNSPGAKVQLSAATTGAYSGILIDQPAISSGITCAGGMTTNTLGGLVDAPAAQVTLGSSGDTFNMGGLIAGNVTLGTPGSSNVTVTVGG